MIVAHVLSRRMPGIKSASRMLPMSSSHLQSGMASMRRTRKSTTDLAPCRLAAPVLRVVIRCPFGRDATLLAEVLEDCRRSRAWSARRERLLYMRDFRGGQAEAQGCGARSMRARMGSHAARFGDLIARSPC